MSPLYIQNRKGGSPVIIFVMSVICVVPGHISVGESHVSHPAARGCGRQARVLRENGLRPQQVFWEGLPRLVRGQTGGGQAKSTVLQGKCFVSDNFLLLLFFHFFWIQIFDFTSCSKCSLSSQILFLKWQIGFESPSNTVWLSQVLIDLSKGSLWRSCTST